MLTNGESCNRDWLCWSNKYKAIYCAPCYILKTSKCNASHLTDKFGYNSKYGWKKLYDRIPSHESSNLHKENYIQWKNSQNAALTNTRIVNLLYGEIESEQKNWTKLLERLLDVILFLSERGLAFFGSDYRIGSPQNGNFLGLVELLSKYDPVLAEHVSKVRTSQENGERMQVHYLSNRIQNEFIEICGSFLQHKIIEEIKETKYFSIIADATPDSSNKEQTAIIIRYVKMVETDFSIEERFICFDNFSNKTGNEIAKRILSLLMELNLNFENCVGQGYDNGSNMAGKYNGVQSILLAKNCNCVFCPCKS